MLETIGNIFFICIIMYCVHSRLRISGVYHWEKFCKKHLLYLVYDAFAFLYFAFGDKKSTIIDFVYLLVLLVLLPFVLIFWN